MMMSGQKVHWGIAAGPPVKENKGGQPTENRDIIVEDDVAVFVVVLGASGVVVGATV